MQRIFPLTLAFITIGIGAFLVAWQINADEDSNDPGSQGISNDPALEGVDSIVGHAFIDYRAGFEADELARNAPFIVVGRVTEARLVEEPKVTDIPVSVVATLQPDVNLTPPPGKNPVDTLRTVTGAYKTEYVFDVEDVLGSPLGSDAAQVRVREGGGLVDGAEIMYDGFPVYRIGQRYLMFLSENPLEGSEGTYYTVSGVHGAYLLLEGSVYRQVGEDGRWVGYGDKSEAAFLQDLRAEAATR
jgi:hypothetical protein